MVSATAAGAVHPVGDQRPVRLGYGLDEIPQPGVLSDGDGKAALQLASDRNDGVGEEAAVGAHSELSSGPSPCQQLTAHPVQLMDVAPPEASQEGTRGGWRLDHAAVPPVGNTSASSMQSPPASAEATRVSILSPVLARPGAFPRSTWLPTISPKPRCRPRVTGRRSPALVTKRWSSKAGQTHSKFGGDGRAEFLGKYGQLFD